MSRYRHYEGPLDCFDMGDGPLVILIHGAASTAGQWKDLIRSLAPDYHVVAPNLWGYGKTPAWPDPGNMTLDQEIAPVLDLIGHHTGPVHVVGHSHGASLAALTAVNIMDRLASLTVWETNAFHLLDNGNADDKRAWQQSYGTFGDYAARAGDSDLMDISREMLDFWMGDGYFDAMPAEKQQWIASAIRPVTNEIDAIFKNRIAFENLAPKQERILHMADPETAAPAWRVAQILREMLPDMDWREYPGLTHMGPVFFPDKVNPDIIAHIGKWS